LRPYILQYHRGNFQQLTRATLDIAIGEWKKIEQNGKQRKFLVPPGKKMRDINLYVKPILQLALRDMDLAGEQITAKVKSDTYKSIIADPDSYVNFGANINSTYTLNQVPVDIDHYWGSRFLASVYESSNTFFKI
jgi:hypothetical protein